MQYHSTTTQGLRERNEDTIFPMPGQVSQGLFIVADGLGGHADGKMASELAVKTVREIVENEDPRDYVMGGSHMEVDELMRAFLSDVVRNTGIKLWHTARQRGTDMGTTLLVVLIEGERGYCAQVGDCALFISQNGQMPMRKVTSEHRKGTQLTRSLGAEEQVIADVISFGFHPDSVLVMGCDGFWEHVSVEQMSQMVLERPYFILADELGRAALDANSQDNVSVIVVEGEGFIKTHAVQQSQSYARYLDNHPDPAQAKILSWLLSAFNARYNPRPVIPLPTPAREEPQSTGITPEHQGQGQPLVEKVVESLDSNVTLIAENARLAESNRRMKEVVDSQQHDIDELKRQLNITQERLLVAQARNEQLEHELSEQQAARDAQSAKVQALEQLIQDNGVAMIALEDEKQDSAALAVENTQLLDRVKTLTVTLDEREQALAQLKTQLEQTLSVAHFMEAQKKFVEQSLDNLASQNQALQKEKQELEILLQKTRQQVEELQSKLDRQPSSARWLNKQPPAVNFEPMGDQAKIDLIKRINELIAEKQKLYQENRALKDELDLIPSSRSEIADLRDQIFTLKKIIEEKDAIIRQKDQQIRLQPRRSSIVIDSDVDLQAQIQMLKDENEKLAREVLYQRNNNLAVYRRLLELYARYPTQCEEVLTLRWIKNIRTLLEEESRSGSNSQW